MNEMMNPYHENMLATKKVTLTVEKKEGNKPCID